MIYRASASMGTGGNYGNSIILNNLNQTQTTIPRNPPPNRNLNGAGPVAQWYLS